MRLSGERSGDRTLCIISSLFPNPLFAQTLSPSIKHMSWTKKWKLWCWTTLCQNVEMSEVWKWESQLWATGPVLKRPQNNTKISEWTKTTTMGSGLGLVSDKTHRVLSSLVGEVAPVLANFWQLASSYQVILSVCFAGVSHGAMLSWPAEVLPQVNLKVRKMMWIVSFGATTSIRLHTPCPRVFHSWPSNTWSTSVICFGQILIVVLKSTTITWALPTHPPPSGCPNF